MTNESYLIEQWYNSFMPDDIQDQDLTEDEE